MLNHLKIMVIFVFLGAFAQADIGFDHYHSQDEINQYLKTVAQENPSFVWFKNLGVSARNREINYVIVAHGNPATMPAIYMNGTHHGDEWSATEGIVGLIDYLVVHHNDPDVSALLKTYAIYLQPLVNPDGHAARTREDSFGRDPNRDYAYPGSSEANAFKLQEIQLVKGLIDQVHFRAAAAYHSGIEEVLWSWCYTGTTTQDQNNLAQIGALSAKAMGFDRYMQSFFDYATKGEFIDYAYMKDRTVALTFEVSTDKTPRVALLPGVVSRSVNGAMAFMYGVHAMDMGLLPQYDFVLPAAHYGKTVWPAGERLE